MGKKEKPAAVATDGTEAPKKRSKLKLVVLAVVPLALAGGGYFGWTMFMGGAGEDVAHASEGAEHGEGAAEEAAGHGEAGGHGEAAHAAAPISLPREIAAETSFTYSFALAELMKERCGKMDVAGLHAASDEEARADGILVSLSWIAANRRTGTVTEKSCDYIRAEIGIAEDKANGLAAAAAAPAEEEGGGHH